MFNNDTWAVSPAAANPTLMLNAQTVGAAGAVTLLTNTTAVQGCGYKLIFTSVGNSSGMTYTITGYVVGQPSQVTEVIAGPNATTANSVNYWATVTSVVASAAATGAQSIGITGSLALPRTRIMAVHYVGAATAGSISVAMNTSGTNVLTVATPATATFAEYLDVGAIPVKSSTLTDIGIVTLTQVTLCTFICG